jgi:hypothetical protein
MELYLLGSLLGLGYYLNSNPEVKKKKLNYPKKMYRGNVYDYEQYDRAENEIYDRAKVKFDAAQNVFENNVVGQYTPDVLYSKENQYEYTRNIEDFTNPNENTFNNPHEYPMCPNPNYSEFGNSVRKDFQYMNEDCKPMGLNPQGSNPQGLNPQGSNPQGSNPQGSNPQGSNPLNSRKLDAKYSTNKTMQLDSSLNKLSNMNSNEIKCWNDDGGIETHTDLDEQFKLLEKGGKLGAKQTYEEPWHNNMVPFFGGSVKQNVDPTLNETKLSMYTGQWDYSRKQKQEIAPMFKPEKDIRNVYGDQQFLEKLTTNLDRFVPSLMRTNEAPTEKLYVAPGLNLGYNENPDFGFHDPVRVLPKTTNELRAKNKPKLTYDKPVISGKSLTQEGTKRLNVNKNLPELVVYNEKGERTFGAKSVTLGETGRPIYLLGRAVRSFSRFFMGAAKDTHTPAQSSRTAYKDNCKNKNHKLNRMGIAAAQSNRKQKAGLTDIAKNTKRQTIEKNVHQGYFTSIFKALTNYVAPAKQTIRETTSAPTRVMNTKLHKNKGILRNPDEKAKRTIRETTELNSKNGHLKPVRKVGLVYNPDNLAKKTLRETTEANSKNGNLKTSRKLGKAYDPNDIAKTTLRETTELNTKDGNLKTTRKVGKAYDPEDLAKTTIRETTELNTKEGNLKTTKKVGKAYDPEDVAKTTLRETTELNTKEGNLTTTRKVGKAYDPEDLAKTTIRETTEMNSKNGNLTTNTRKLGKAYDPEDKPEYTLKDIVKVSNYKGVIGNTEKKLKIYDPDDKAKYTTRQDTLVIDYYGGKEAGQNNGAYEVIDVEARYTSRQDALVENYTGVANNDVSAPQSYKAAYNAETNELKEKIAEGRAPTQNSVKLMAGMDKQCVEIKRIDEDRKNPRGLEKDLPNVDRMYQLPPTMNSDSITKDKSTVINSYTDRITPDILDTFRNNPYTQSLHSYVFA